MIELTTQGNVKSLLDTSTDTLTTAENEALTYYSSIMEDDFLVISSTSTKIVEIDTRTGGTVTLGGTFTSSISTITSMKYTDANGSFTLTGRITVLSDSLSSGTLSDINISYGSTNVHITGTMKYDYFGNITGTASSYSITSDTVKLILNGSINIVDNIGTITDAYLIDTKSSVNIHLSGSMASADLIAEMSGSPTFDDLLNSPTLFSGHDTIYASTYRTTWHGYNGNDSIYGTSAAETLYGDDGNDTINGKGGGDTMIGGIGNDTYTYRSGDTLIENLNQGTDTVYSSATYTLQDNFENLILTGSDRIDGNGNAASNSLDSSQNSASNTLRGGDGDDTYIVGAGDVVFEDANQGTDTIHASVSWTLGDNQENLFLDSATDANGTGNSLDNNITGNGNRNILDGGIGSDTLSGGIGDDTYIVDSGDTVVEESNRGIDTVISNATWTLGDNLENLTLTGNAAIDGTGNALNNTLDGSQNTAANLLMGGMGNDVYIVDSQDTIIEDLNVGDDTVKTAFDWALGENLENLTLTGSANISGTGNALNNILDGSLNTAANALNGGAGNDTYIIGLGDTVTEDENAGQDTVKTSINWSLGANLENLTLMGSSAISGNGNNLNNTLNGSLNAAANKLAGGMGNDTYIIGSGDTVTEAANAGTDTVMASIAVTLGLNIENLTLTGIAAISGTGNTLNNTLDGSQNTAANKLSGGTGNDTYILGAGDTAIEAANAGIDTVNAAISITLGENVENLTLTGSAAIGGTGNALNNTLDGSLNTAANKLAGGLGNDTYIVGAGDILTEAASAGTDTVMSSTSWALGANLENLTLTGSSAINGTGNTLANRIIGNASDNILSGGTGADALSGDKGNDTYFVDNVGDVVTETANAGTDIVKSAITWTLGANIENLTLTGSTAINGKGNTQDNIITGNSAANTLQGENGNDTLIGGAGADQLFGGAGADIFRFNSSTLGTIDTVKDFSVAQGDVLNFANILSGYDPLASAISDFVQISNSGSNSVVKVDIDGTGTIYSWQQVALLSNVTGLTDEAALLASNTISVS